MNLPTPGLARAEKKAAGFHSEKEAEFMFGGLMAHVFWPA